MFNTEGNHNMLIGRSTTLMRGIEDPEHNGEHIKDVVRYVEEIMDRLEDCGVAFNRDVCIIAAYWHDVGRVVQVKGHEKLSAEMLASEMETLGYDGEFVTKCYKAIEAHKWNMQPSTIEGFILRDADKIAWLGINRWKECIKHGKELNDITELLPKLREEILHFECSREIYDKALIELFCYVYKCMLKGTC